MTVEDLFDCRLTTMKTRILQLAIREARPEDAEAIVRILNPIIATGLYTVGTAQRHGRIGGGYIDEIIIEKLLVQS